MPDDSPIDAYLATLPAGQREMLQRLRNDQLRHADIKFGGRALLLFAGWKVHCSLYGLTDTFVAAHADELKGYRRTKGSLHFTLEAPLSESLVEKMVRVRLAELAAAT